MTRAGGDTEACAARGWDVAPEVDLTTAVLPVAADAPDGIQLCPLRGNDDWEQPAHLGVSSASEAEDACLLVFERRRAAAQRGLVESGRARCFGAFDGDGLVTRLGLVRLGDRARYQDVATLESYRRQGIAGALVRAAGEWALEDPSVGQLVIVAAGGRTGHRTLRAGRLRRGGPARWRLARSRLIRGVECPLSDVGEWAL
ncbi:MAG: GNAT family N-acetyltransferase, partial [Terracoccus sp.]